MFPPNKLPDEARTLISEGSSVVPELTRLTISDPDEQKPSPRDYAKAIEIGQSTDSMIPT